MSSQCVNSEDNDVSIKTLEVRFGDSATISIERRLRNFCAPVEVHHEMDVATVVAAANASRATLAVNQTPLKNGRESDPIPLHVGRNLVQIDVTAQDGRTKNTLVLKIFRACPAPSWRKTAATAPWSPRDSAGELVFNGQMWLLGGYTPALVSDVWCSSDGVAWTRTGTVPSSKGIDLPIALVFENKMWVTDVDGVLFASPDGKAWSVVAEDTPWKGRNAAAGVVFAGKMWVMGGMKKRELFNDVWSSPDGIHWTREIEQAPWSKRQIHHALLVLDNKIWLLGGGILGSSYHPFIGYNDVWNSPDGRHWEQVADHAPWPSRIWGSSVVYRNRLWIIGGFRSEPTWENLGDVWYSADGVAWRRLQTAPTCRHSGANNAAVAVSHSIWAPRHEISAYVFDDKLWLVGGMVWPLMNDVWQLAISKLSFVTQPVFEGFAHARYEYAAQADFNQSGQPVRYRLVKSPDWLNMEPSTGVIRGTPPTVMDAEIIIEAYDNTGETARQTYTLHVIPVV